jgi:hypothetical protein
VPGNHHGRQIYEEYFVPSGKTEFGKRECREGTGKQLYHRDNNGEFRAVEKIEKKVNVNPDFFVIIQTEDLWYPAYGNGKDFRVQFKGRTEHPDKGNQHNESDKKADNKKYHDTYLYWFIFSHHSPTPFVPAIVSE